LCLIWIYYNIFKLHKFLLIIFNNFIQFTQFFLNNFIQFVISCICLLQSHWKIYKHILVYQIYFSKWQLKLNTSQIYLVLFKQYKGFQNVLFSVKQYLVTKYIILLYLHSKIYWLWPHLNLISGNIVCKTSMFFAQALESEK